LGDSKRRPPTRLSINATNDILSTNDPSISQSAPGSSEIHIDSLDHETLYISGTKIGKPTAPLQVIGYSDFQCPLCKKAHIPLFQVIKEHPEKIHFIHKDYPLDEKCNRKISGSFHNQACAAAFFVRCAKKFDRFFELSASLFHTSETMDNEYLAQVASAHGLSSEAMQNCMSQPSIKDAIAEDIESGLELGLQGTPTFIVNGKMITGARDRNWWLAAIDGRIDDK